MRGGELRRVAERVRRASACGALALGAGCSATTLADTTARDSRKPNAVGAVLYPSATIAGTTYYSSTRLTISWLPPTLKPADRYRVTWAEVGSTDVQTTTTRISGPLPLFDLKAGTEYRFTIASCVGEQCYDGEAAVLLARTPDEVWQLVGSGGGLAGLTRIVPDGNVKLHALFYASTVPLSLEWQGRLYYGPQQQSAKGLAVATGVATARSAGPFSFTSRAGSSGLINPPTAAPLVREVNTGQGVALSAAMGGRVRLFFEATGSDNRTRILSVDSRDGYEGMDFNAGAPTTCSTQADYSPGGNCAPSVVIGVEGDAVGGNARIANARQFKIGVRTLTDGRWDGAPGTFMVFTTDPIAGCTTASHNQGYAVWSGTQWVVQYDSNGCPRLMKSMQAAHPLHIGGSRFKLYYGDPSDQTGRVAGSPLPFLGPKKLFYANGARTGDSTRVDFDDWEPVSAGRTLVFLWPDGSPLDATARGYIDDFTVVMPAGSLLEQVMYVAITDGRVVPFAAGAGLVNP